MGLWIYHQLMGGVLSHPSPPLTWLLDVVARNRKMRSKAHQKRLPKCSGHVFAKFNIEVTRGQIYRSSIFLLKCVIISETVLGPRPVKKALDSPWDVLLLTRPHIWAEINSLGARGKKNTITAAWQKKKLHANDFWNKKDSSFIRAPSCSSRQGASQHILGDFEWSDQYLTSGQGHVSSHVGPSRSCCISVDAHWKDKHNETMPISVALFDRELLAKTCLWSRVTPDYLYEGHRPEFAPEISTKA